MRQDRTRAVVFVVLVLLWGIVATLISRPLGERFGTESLVFVTIYTALLIAGALALFFVLFRGTELAAVPLDDTRVLALIPVAVAINVAGGLIIAALRVPLYVDSIGTVLAGALAGPVAGALTGIIANVVLGMLGNVPFVPFAITAAVIGVLAGWFAQLGWLRPEAGQRRPAWLRTLGERADWLRGRETFVSAALAGLITGLVAAIVSAPIAAFIFGGITGAGTDALVALFRSMGANVLAASFAQGAVSDPIDKLITFVVVWLILRAMPRRQLLRFPQGEELVE